MGWNKPCENLKVGNMVLKHYDRQSKVGNWKWGQVLQAVPDCDGLVRTVLVRYTIPRKSRTGQLAKEIKLAVQRLVLLYSQQEMQRDEEGAGVK